MREGGGEGLIPHSAIPLLKFSKMPFVLFFGTSKPLLQSSECQVCLQSICDNATVGSCSGGPASWCFLGSSWVIYGHTMCILMLLMPPVMSLMIFLTPTCGWEGGGGLCPRQFLFWRAKASCPIYLSIGVLHPQNFLIYITGLFILMLVRERSLKPHIRCFCFLLWYYTFFTSQSVNFCKITKYM